MKAASVTREDPTLPEEAKTEAAPAAEPYGAGVVHVGTKVVVTFGVLNRNGDLLPKKERHFSLDDLTDATWNDLRQKIEEFRSELFGEFCTAPPPAG